MESTSSKQQPSASEASSKTKTQPKATSARVRDVQTAISDLERTFSAATKRLASALSGSLDPWTEAESAVDESATQECFLVEQSKKVTRSTAKFVTECAKIPDDVVNSLSKSESFGDWVK